MTRSARDLGAAVLAVPQFTLYGDVAAGIAAGASTAPPIPRWLCPCTRSTLGLLRAEGLEVATGVFQAMMRVQTGERRPGYHPVGLDQVALTGRTTREPPPFGQDVLLRFPRRGAGEVSSRQ